MVTKKVKAFIILFVTLLLHISIMAQVVLRPRPLCISQYTLANRACALVRRISPSETEELLHEDEHQRHGHHHNSTRHNEHGHKRERDHVNGHEQKRKHGHEDNHHRESRHGHKHHHHAHHDALTDECCRWLREVDSECVCDILIRLPLFLTRPEHNYVLKIGDKCTVTYRCTRPLLP